VPPLSFLCCVHLVFLRGDKCAVSDADAALEEQAWHCDF